MEYRQYFCNEKRHNRYDNIIPGSEKKIKDIKSDFFYSTTGGSKPTHIFQRYKTINDEEVFFAVIQDMDSPTKFRIVKFGTGETQLQSNLLLESTSWLGSTGDLCLSNNYNIFVFMNKVYKIGDDLSILNTYQFPTNDTRGLIANKNDYFYFCRGDSSTITDYFTRYDAINNSVIELSLGSGDDKDKFGYYYGMAIANNGKVGFITASGGGTHIKKLNIVNDDLSNRIEVIIDGLYSSFLICLDNNFLIRFYDTGIYKYRLYDENLNLLWTSTIGTTFLCVDSDNNFYIKDGNKIKQLDGSSGDILKTLDILTAGEKTMNINNNSNFYYFRDENNNRRYRSYNFSFDPPSLVNDITFEKKVEWSSRETIPPFNSTSFYRNPNWFITQQNHILYIYSYWDFDSERYKYNFIVYKLEPALNSNFFPFIWWYWWNENCGEEYDKNVYHETYKGKDPKRGI